MQIGLKAGGFNQAFQGIVTLYRERVALVGWLMILCGVLVPSPSVPSFINTQTKQPTAHHFFYSHELITHLN